MSDETAEQIEREQEAALDADIREHEAWQAAAAARQRGDRWAAAEHAILSRIASEEGRLARLRIRHLSGLAFTPADAAGE